MTELAVHSAARLENPAWSRHQPYELLGSTDSSRLWCDVAVYLNSMAVGDGFSW